MEQLIAALKELLADTVALKFKAHGYHWNVEGDDFPQAHTFFEMIYNDYEEATDEFAENLRRLDTYAPFKLSRLTSLSTVSETDITSDFEDMAMDLLKSNDAVLAKLKDAFDLADAAREQGIANFLAERIDMHAKWHWQLSAVVKEDLMESAQEEMTEPELPTVMA
jgi:starvation-inducible DNA-binding protein